MKIVQNILKPQNLFIIVCLFWGLLIAIVTPPFQAPDEPEHLFKMWGYTQGTLTYQIKDKWVGGVVPKSFIEIYDYYSQYRWTFDKTSLAKTNEFSKLELNKNDKSFLRYNAPVYTPVSYFPAFLFLWVLKLLNISPLLMTYLMRICFLLLYTALGYIALKLTPCKKWMFFTLETLPLMISQGAAINTDGLFFGILFIFLAYTLRLRFDKNIEKISQKQICIWGIMTILLSILKFAYAPLLFLYFLLPREKTVLPENYLKNFFIILLSNFLVIAFFLSGILGAEGYRYWSYINHNRSNFVVIKEVLSNPFEFLYMVVYTFKMGWIFFLANMVSNIGVLMFTIPVWATRLYWIIIFISAFYSTKEESDMSIDLKNKWIMFFVIVVLFFITFLSVYLVYQTKPIIRGMQGRYFSPLLPIFLLLFMSTKFNLKNKCCPIVIFCVTQLLLAVNIFGFIIRFY